MMARIEHKDIGDRMQPQATFTVGGSPTDPTQIVVRQQDAAGTEATITTASSPGTLTTASTPLARMSAGVFKLIPGISATAAGHWFFRFEATGTAESAEDFQYDVDPSEFTSNAGVSDQALVSLADAKDWLQIQNVETTNDLETVRAINDVSQRFTERAQREFKVNGTNPQARLFDVDATAIQYGVISVGDMAAAPTQVRIIGTDWATVLSTVSTSSFFTFPAQRAAWEPIRRIAFGTGVLPIQPGYRVEVTGTFGFPSVPGDVRDAVLDAIVAKLDRKVEHYSQDLGAATGGGEGTNVVVFAGRTQYLSMPPSSIEVARRYADPAIA
jgi:hypothetical protein